MEVIPRVRYVAQRLLDSLDAAGARFSRRRRTLRVAARNSLCGRYRLGRLQGLADEVRRRGVPGDVVECGVYRGGSAAAIGERLLPGSSRRMWLFDVFTGMPPPGPQDPREAWTDVGKFVSSEAIVRGTLEAAGVPADSVRIVPGRFEDTLPGFEVPPLAFLHVDCDWYEPVKLCLQTFFEAVRPGGLLVFDDYGYWSGCRRAVDEFLAERCPGARLVPIDSTSHYVRKD